MQQLDGVEEPIAPRADGSLQLAGFSEPGLALDTIAYWIGQITDIVGELPPGVITSEYIDQEQ